MVKRFSKERVFYIAITLIIVIVIFLVSSISSFPILQKTGIDISIFYHFGVFFMFTFFLTLSLINKKLDNKAILIILLISLAYAMSDEFHQLFVVGRFADVKDALIDFAGSISSVSVIKIIERLKKIEDLSSTISKKMSPSNLLTYLS
jgi:VanZ family protein